MLLLALQLLGSSAFAAAPGSPWGPEPAPIGWGATRADWTLHVREGEPVRVEGRYVLTAVDPQSAVLTLAGPQLLVTDVSGPVFARPEGLSVALDPDKRRVEQTFSGLYSSASDGSFSLPVLRATRTHVTVDAPGLDVTIDGAVDGWLTPTDQLRVTWRPHREGEKPYEALVAQGEAAATFRGDAGALLVDAVVRWRIVRGEAKRLTFAANGLEELEIAGEGVAKWRREGDTVIVEPKAPAKGLFTITVRGRAPLAKNQRNVPVPEPTNVLRTDRFVTMARSDEGELIPVAMPESVPLARLPAWAKNLGDGVPLVAWHGPQPVTVLPGNFEAIQGPDTVITQARYTLAAAAEGHAALRMNLRVRNERRQYLHLVPGPGWRPIVIRVGNQPVSWLSDGQGGIYVPLEKSVETVKGLLSFPVDVEWIGDSTPEWGKRGDMALTLPSVDAPVQAAFWEVHLPRGYRALQKADSSTGRMVLGDLQEKPTDDQSEYAAAERERQEVVSSALQNAVSAYKQNDWSTAQRWLDEAKNVDAGNEDAQSLQANLDVIEGRAQSNDLGSRRVRDLAKAKTSSLQESQQAVEKEAEFALRSGDLDAAEAKYAEAEALASTLQKTEQLESAEQTSKIVSARKKLGEIQEQRQAKAEFEAQNAPAQVYGWGDDNGDAFGDTDADGLADAPAETWYPEEPETSADYAGSGFDEVVEGVAAGDGEGYGAPGFAAIGGEDVSGVRADDAGVLGALADDDRAYGGVAGGTLDGTIGGLIGGQGATTESTGIGGFGMKGTGEGGGGAATGLGSLGTIGTAGRGSGSGQGYGSGSANGMGAVKKPAVTIDFEDITVEAEKPEPPRMTVTTKSAKPPAKQAPAKSRSAGPMPATAAPAALEALGYAEPAPMAPPPAPVVMPASTPAPAPKMAANKPAMAPPPPPPPPPPPAAARDVERVSQSETITKDMLSRVPSGRSYQTTTVQAAGTTADAKKEEAKPGFLGGKAKEKAAARAEPSTGMMKKSADKALKADEAYEADEVMYRREIDEEPMLDLPAEPPMLEPEVEETPVATPPADLAPEPQPDPNLAPRPRRIPEKRAPLVASPSPMALAMPLDGPTITTTQALQPAGTFPTFTFRYKALPSENR